MNRCTPFILSFWFSKTQFYRALEKLKPNAYLPIDIRLGPYKFLPTFI